MEKILQKLIYTWFAGLVKTFSKNIMTAWQYYRFGGKLAFLNLDQGKGWC